MSLKKISYFIIIILLIGLISSGCLFDSSSNLSVKYNIDIDNPDGNKFNLSLPTLILGNRFYNTPRDLKPIVDIEDYSVINGDAKLSYKKIENSTLLSISSSSKNVSLQLTKNSFTKDKYTDYKGDKAGDVMVCPFLNSYFNMSKGNYGKEIDKIGIIYEGKSNLNVTINYKMIEEEGDQYTLDDSFTVEDNGFQLKEITIRFEQPAP
ncbi:MAG: hypothetical protein ACOC40_00845 [Thermoplasmatota archaeon]